MSGPVRVQPDPDDIPADLKKRDQWVCWRVEVRDGDPTKVPINAETGGRAKASDPEDMNTARATWTSFEAAWAYHTDPETDSAGIGYVFDPDGPFCGVDLDDCRDPDGPTVETWAREILEALETYAEVSPSGTGVHAILRGEVPEGGNRKGDVELYDSARYFTVTGEHLGLTPLTVEARQAELEAVHAEYIAEDDTGESPDGDVTPGVDADRPGVGFPGSDEELIETARNAGNGGKFDRLWSGDTGGYDSHSEADQALCSILAFYTGRDPDRIDRLFRQSGLVRDKWTDREDYRERTIGTALDGRTEFYEPSGNGGDGRGGEPPSDDPYEAAKDELNATTDPARALAVWQVLRDEIHVLSAEPSGRIYAYRDGVWKPDGKRLLRERAADLMGAEYSKNVLEELVERVRAVAPVDIEDMGTPHRTVAVENGLLDLTAREVRDLIPADRALARLPVGYDPDATCPRWESFIDESVEADRVEAVQEFVGYCMLVSELPYSRVLLAVGGGSNGKTTFLNTVTALLGPENVTGFSLGELVDSEYYVAEMHGAIANIDADVTGSIGHARKFKKLTGGDRKVSARRPYGEPFDYRPTTKQLYAANEVPDTKLDDDAFFRRWLIVEFPTTFTDTDLPGPDKDPELEDVLLGELPGILNWALDGLNRLLEQGHFTNEGTTEDKRERWQSWGDTVERFISKCVTTDGDGKFRTGEVYERYTAWCAQHGETAESQQTLTAAIKKLDGVRYSTTFRFDGKQARGFKGLTFTAEAPPPTDAEIDSTQATFSQDAAVRLVRETVDELVEANDGEPVPIETVTDALEGQLGGHDPLQYIENGLKAGVFYEPADGAIRPT